MAKKSLKKGIDEIKEIEEKILKKVAKEEREEKEIRDVENKILSGVKNIGHPAAEKVRRFSFSDFGQAVVGAIVFGVPAMWTPDFWNFIDGIESVPAVPIPTYKILVFHLFILFCIMVTLNFAFRKKLNLDLKFLGYITKRIFYVYLTVLLVETIILWMFNKVSATMTTITLIRYIMATTSIGMVGAVTFDFIMD